jgi:hypothetical protein
LVTPHINTGFNPGVDIDPAFVEAVNLIGFPGNTITNTALTAELNMLDPGVDTEWGWIPYLRLCVDNGQLVSGYCLDANDISITFVNNGVVPVDFNQHSIQLAVDTTAWRNSSVILVPRVGMSHGSYQLMLDTGHWGPTLDPVVLYQPTGNVTISHSFYSGLITYTNG